MLKQKTKTRAVILALLAAGFYAINTPFSKVLLNNVTPTFIAAFLYLGAGLGVGIMYLFHIKKREKIRETYKAGFTLYNRNDWIRYSRPYIFNDRYKNGNSI